MLLLFSNGMYCRLLKHKTVIKMPFCDLKPAKTYWLAALMGGGEADYTGRESSTANLARYRTSKLEKKSRLRRDSRVEIAQYRL